MSVDQESTNIFCLPEEILDKILSSLCYDEISRTRSVCKKFDNCCQRLLNQGFLKVEKFHSHCLRDIKAQLPRRESERRDHPLARHSDILTAIETRLSLLSMTFMKYVDMNLCCFIPGKVIDEIYLVLRNIQSTPTPPRSHEILQELRDISSMAMEHFDEHIVPLLKQKIGATRRTMTLSSGTTAMGVMPSVRSPNACFGGAIRREMSKLQLWAKQLNVSNASMKKEFTDHKQKMVDLRRKVKEQDKKISDQNHIIVEQGARISEQDGKISEISRKLLECDRHISDVVTEISRSREECIIDKPIPSGSLPKISKDSNINSIDNEFEKTDKVETLPIIESAQNSPSLVPKQEPDVGKKKIGKRKNRNRSSSIDEPAKKRIKEPTRKTPL